jgi:tetratricopeptide (TPR) repeat protein
MSISEPYALNQLSVEYGPFHLQADQPEPPRRRFSMKSLTDWLTLARSLVITVIFFLLLFFFAALVYDGVLRRQVVIESIQIPETLKSQGYSEQIIAHRLRDAIEEISASDTRKEKIIIAPNAAGADIVIPEIGLSVASAIQFLRKFLNFSATTISGEFMCTANPCAQESVALRLRIIGGGSYTVDLEPIAALRENEYFSKAAEELLLRIDPYVVASYYYTHDTDRALQLARQLIRDDHKDKKWAYILLGLIYQDRSSYPQAIAQFRRAIDIDKDFAVGYLSLATALYATGEFKRACAAYTTAKTLDSELANAYYGLGGCLVALNDTAGAIEAYREATRIDSRFAPAYYDWATALAATGDYSDALPLYRRAAEIDERYVNAIFTLAQNALQAGDNGTAIAGAEEYLSLAPEGFWARPAADLITRLSGTPAVVTPTTAQQAGPSSN